MRAPRLWPDRFWRDHSLSIVLGILTALFFGFALAKGEDISIADFGHTTAGLLILFALSGSFHERNKPED